MDDKLAIVSTIERGKWEKFVWDHPSGTIFQTADMFDLYQSVSAYKPWFNAVVDTNGEIQGMILSCVIVEKGVKTFFSSRSIVHGGPLVRSDNIEIASLLLENYLKEARKKAIYSQFRNVSLRDSLEKAFLPKGFNYHDHYTVIVSLDKNLEQLLSTTHKKKRNNIRRAVKKGAETRELVNKGHIDHAIALIQNAYVRARIPGPPRDLLLNAKNIFGDRIQFFGSFYKNELVAAKAMLNYKNMVYDWYSGYNHQFSYLCPNDLLTWDSIRWAKERGFRIYDMGGAGKPGVQYGVRNFKIKFGGKLENTGRYMRIHKSLLYRAGVSYIHLLSKI
jgi:serine/alanine adding enzyme